MSNQWSLISIILLFQILSIYSTPILSETNTHLFENTNDGHQRAHNAFLNLIDTILDESNPAHRATLLNQLREYLNRMCISGYFGTSRAEACQHVVDVMHQTYLNNHRNDEEISDTSNEPHGVQKRFFCNGFIGCKSSSG